ncbi:MAG: UDP-N-acetylglucosamine 2-epimerase (non-hydrolyzing) [Candidatus Cloacimonetes bacterium]|nr:UDP-N-acetylglucosamine 2-epimerase (non-hydrolyzing) [Candidatus Cloacimonadota bacterium]
MKLISVVSTRPDYIKETLRHHYLKEMGIEEILVNTGQHYDHNMSQIFFDELKIPIPDYSLNVSTGLVGRQTGEIITQMEEILLKEHPDLTLVYGDVTSSLAAALASVKLRIPVVHIEGGIRTDSRFNPEDINRKICDHLSDTIFVPTELSLQNLLKENFPSDRIFFYGDVTKDILLYTLNRHDIKIERKDYILITLHREENVDNSQRLTNIIRALNESGEKIVFPVHPRTRKQLERFGLQDKIGDNIQLLEPQGYINFIRLLAGARKVLTDSGTVRREAYIMYKPVITLIEIIWWPEIVKCGWNLIVGADKNKIVDAIRQFSPPAEHPEFFGDGNAERKILNKILSLYG